MKGKGKISQFINKIFENNDISEKNKTKITKATEKAIKVELKKAPRIALIGKTGVGKSTTINALFNTNLNISHFEACTQKAEELVIKGSKGDVIIYDMPGLGEDIDTDEIHKETYKDILPKCDVILWIMVANAAGRAMSFDQLMLRDVIGVIDNNILDRLVVGINQADLMEPMNWNETANIPSKKQLNYLEKRTEDVRAKLGKIAIKLSRNKVMFYSAKKRYRLVQLFEVMMKACPHEREWVLNSRRDIADYRELIDPEILKLIERN